MCRFEKTDKHTVRQTDRQSERLDKSNLRGNDGFEPCCESMPEIENQTTVDSQQSPVHL